MRVIVMGAGVVGVTTAWYLHQAGHEVTVLERNRGAACETSFGNGGQISVSHAEPWANPSAPLKLLKWLGREDAPLLFRLRADPAQWRWGLQFLRECSSKRTRHNMLQLINLGTYSRGSLQALREETGIQYDHLTKGIMHFYTSQKDFDEALEPARIMQEMGVVREIITPDRVVEIEPARASARNQLAGATFTPADESGDVNLFTTRLAALAAEKGVKFRYGVRIQKLLVAGGEMQGVELADEHGQYEVAKADAYVLALGSFSAGLARDVGIRLDIYPAKGYSATLPVLDPARAPQVSLTDDEYKLVYSRFGNRLRVAGTAELNGYGMALIEQRAMQHYRALAGAPLTSFAAVVADDARYRDSAQRATDAAYWRELLAPLDTVGSLSERSAATGDHALHAEIDVPEDLLDAEVLISNYPAPPLRPRMQLRPYEALALLGPRVTAP